MDCERGIVTCETPERRRINENGATVKNGTQMIKGGDEGTIDLFLLRLKLFEAEKTSE